MEYVHLLNPFTMLHEWINQVVPVYGLPGNVAMVMGDSVPA
jgi:hypothetical protein